MRWAIRHETRYRYSVPVVFSPHVLRLNPAPDRDRLISQSLVVDPTPANSFDNLDAFGNRCTHLAFHGNPAQSLGIDSRFVIDTAEIVPLDDLDVPKLPWPVPADDPWGVYRRTLDPSRELDRLAQSQASEAGYCALPFLDGLCQFLRTRINGQIRLAGPAQLPSETLRIARGACRDITVLFLDVCRRVGMAGRFVSGYQGLAETVDGRPHLHAWPEVLLPGIGWRGWDPMYGVRTGGSHIALCAAPEQAATMPVEGGLYFNGPEVNSTLEYDIQLQRVS
jgi:transglutaminase-like putative cysteine protease